MTVAKVGAAARDWLGELRGADDEETFSALVPQIAEAAPELREEVLGLAREFGEGWEDWAKTFFIFPKAQPSRAKAGRRRPDAVPKAVEAAKARAAEVEEVEGAEVGREVGFVGVKPSKAIRKQQEQEFSLTKSPSGIPTTYINAKIAIEKMAVECRYDVFHDRLIVAGFECSGSGDATENLDNVALKVRDRIIQKYGFDPGKNHILDAIVSSALDHAFDPVKDYLDGLRWDGVPRLDRWLVEHLGVDDTPLNRAIGRKMLVAAVRRVKSPGCKFDYIVVLEGEQGSGRSSALKILAGGDDNFSDAEIIGLWPKERQEAIQGVWIYELAELAGYGKADINKFKNFVSQTVDRARPAFGRNRIDRARRCILTATTNDDNYLRDHTGNRRYWPVKLPRGFRIDLKRLAEERDQLWAEAVLVEGLADVEGRREELVIPEELWPAAAAAQAQRLETDPWEDQICELVVDGRSGTWANWVDGTQSDVQGEPEWRVSTADLLTNVLGIERARQFPNHHKRLARVMRRLGWEKPDSPIRIKKKVVNGYRKAKGPASAPKAATVEGVVAKPEGGRGRNGDVMGVIRRRKI
jgi:predicted P-loop ATPase